MLLIQNGRVLDPYTQMDALCDVLIGDDGVIAQVAEHIAAPAGCTLAFLSFFIYNYSSKAIENK